MTEAEWMSCTTPIKLLEHLQVTGNVCARKLRLFTVACCRRVERWLPGNYQKLALNRLERLADGTATTEDLLAIHHYREMQTLNEEDEDCGFAGEELDHDARDAAFTASEALAEALRLDQPQSTRDGYRQPLYETIRHAVDSAGYAAIALDKQLGRQLPAQLAEHKALANIVRDIFGNPFRPVAFDDSWRTSTVLALASGIYAEQAFDRMPILADALQDAGCENEDILNHCREQKEHVRACWVLDLAMDRI
jgi:hypothetical protein